MNKSVTPNDLRILIEDYVTAYPEKTGVRNIWRKPLLSTAKADDRFDILPRITACHGIYCPRPNRWWFFSCHL